MTSVTEWLLASKYWPCLVGEPKETLRYFRTNLRKKKMETRGGDKCKSHSGNYCLYDGNEESKLSRYYVDVNFRSGIQPSAFMLGCHLCYIKEKYFHK
jgi:hypothetical protein